MYLMSLCLKSKPGEVLYMFIERITQMLEMRAIQNKYESIHGWQPYNVSSWLSSPEYATSMRSTLDMPKIDTLEYVYTYSMEKRFSMT